MTSILKLFVCLVGWFAAMVGWDELEFKCEETLHNL